jgi:uncharacterized repeat protein (TIGR03803 family)
MRIGKPGNPGLARLWVLAAAALSVAILVPRGAAAWSERVLYYFSAFGGADGADPFAGLIMDGAGSLYGTTEFGGAGNSGVVFKLTPTTETVLHSFGFPTAGLIMDAAGNLYGTTVLGDSLLSLGVVFKLAPDGTETVLYSFCQQAGCVDGALPQAGLIMDRAGNLYGTTRSGGASNSVAVFKLTP